LIFRRPVAAPLSTISLTGDTFAVPSLSCIFHVDRPFFPVVPRLARPTSFFFILFPCRPRARKKPSFSSFLLAFFPLSHCRIWPLPADVFLEARGRLLKNKPSYSLLVHPLSRRTQTSRSKWQAFLTVVETFGSPLTAQEQNMGFKLPARSYRAHDRHKNCFVSDCFRPAPLCFGSTPQSETQNLHWMLRHMLCHQPPVFSPFDAQIRPTPHTSRQFHFFLGQAVLLSFSTPSMQIIILSPQSPAVVCQFPPPF